ncbi:HAD family hydrolase [Saccharopolyspora sp. CA-218241]|uniref:HAD family hydrolase n=1 Tax=Saccharopolyspora sp. CA-218241 TaxID=3240027 RepID=UPI003D99FB6B
MEQVRAVAFDVLETLLDLGPMRSRLAAVGQPPELLQPWFLRLQRDAMALTLAGDVAEFGAVARQALRTETRHTAAEDELDHVLSGFGELPAHPDAEPALRRLTEAGMPVGCLTVGDPEVTARFLAGAGLDGYVGPVITAGEAGVWKPSPGLYRTAAQRLGVPLGGLAVVAVHAWDCHGAKRAGCAAGWCSRLEGRYGAVFAPPDVVGDDLVRVVRGLLGS